MEGRKEGHVSTDEGHTWESCNRSRVANIEKREKKRKEKEIQSNKLVVKERVREKKKEREMKRV